jgi:hypothetical protein
VLDLPVPLGRDLGTGSPVARVLTDGIAIVAPIGQEDARIAVALVHQVGIGGRVVRLAGRQQRVHRQAVRKTLSSVRL